jgi:hypothetical protein
MSEMHRTIGQDAGLSWAAMSRKGGRTPLLISLSYLPEVTITAGYNQSR